MKNLLFSFIQKFFAKEINGLKNESYNKGYDSRMAQTLKDKENSIVFEMQEMLGKPVICVSNEWENPVIGFAQEIIYITKSEQPMLVIKDYLTMTENMSFGKVFSYTEQRFIALFKLDPFERCSLIYTNFYNEEEFSKNKIGQTNTLEEVQSILTKNGFYEKMKSLDKHHIDTV